MSSRLGDLLQRRGDLTADQLDEGASRHQREHGGALATHLVKLGFISEDAAALATSQKEYRLPVVDPLDARHPAARCSALDARRPGAEAPPDPDQPRRARRSPSRWPTRRTWSPSTRSSSSPATTSRSRSPAPTAIQRAIERYYDASANYDDVLSQLGNEDVEVVQDRGGHRPQGARARHRGGAGRPAGERAPHRRDQEARQRHPRRAVREDAPRPLPHRRRALRDHAAAAASSRTPSPRASRSWPARHRRAPPAAGRPHQAEARPTTARWTSASRCCRRSSARRSSCASSTSRTSSST